MLRGGLDLDGELLALAAASHSGEDFHVEGVRKILSGAGLTEDDLRCPPSWPLDPETARRVIALRRGHVQDPDELLGQARRDAGHLRAERLADVRVPGSGASAAAGDPAHGRGTGRSAVTATGVDGCGAPLFALTLTGLARAFRALVLAVPGTPERRVADAMRAHPEWTSGTSRDERRLMDAVPGLLVKGGAEGVDAFALADARARWSRSRTGRTGPGPRSPWRRCACSAPSSPTNSPPSPSSAAKRLWALSGRSASDCPPAVCVQF